MSTIVTRAGKGSALTWTEGDANITNLNTDKLENIVEDTTPQLGGNLDVNGNSIVSVSNADIVIAPNGTGIVSVVSDLEVGYGTGTAAITSAGAYNLDLVTQGGVNSGLIRIVAGVNGNILLQTNGTGHVHIVTDALRLGNLNTEARISTYGTGNLVLTTNEGNDPDPTITIGNGANANITLTPSGTGIVVSDKSVQLQATSELRFADTDSSNYVGFKSPATVSANKIWTLPATDGTAGQLLSTNGSGVLSWVTDSTGGGGGTTSESYFSLAAFTSSTNGTYTNNTQTWTTRLNNTSITFSAGVFTLPSGTWIIEIHFNSYSSVFSTSTSQYKLRNNTASSDIHEFQVIKGSESAGSQARNEIIVLGSSSNLQFQTLCTGGSGANGQINNALLHFIKVA